MPENLKILAQNRKNILLAELAAWLHDVGKAGVKKEWIQKIDKELGKWLETRDVTGIHLQKAPLNQWLMAQAHGLAHFDKQEPDTKDSTDTVDSPFGNVVRPVQHFNEQNHPWLQSRKTLSNKTLARAILTNFYADSRLPVNEVTLWSWAESAGSLAKASWAHAVFKNISPNERFKDLETILKSLEQERQALIQRKDKQIESILNELEDNIPGKNFGVNFKGYVSGGKEEESPLRNFAHFLDEWLPNAKQTQSQNRLTQQKWSSFLNNLEDLYAQLKTILGLLQWRLLSLRTNGLEYILSASSIPDLMARKELLADAWNRVQTVLEETYPLGLEVYRDENGPVFVVPDLDNLPWLENPDDNHKALHEYILEAFREGTVKENASLAIDGEVVPVFKLDEKAWKGQPAPAELPPIGNHIKDAPPCQSDPTAIAQAWGNHTAEICSVCGLRPQGPGPKAMSRKMCDICEQRRADRAKSWAEGIGLSPEEPFRNDKADTIWLDEVADANGRVALIAGRFDLAHWLDGSLVRSLAVLTPNDQNGHAAEKVAKNPSFARLRRIWETTLRFWQDIVPTDAPPEELRKFCEDNNLSLTKLWEGPLSLKKSVAGKETGEKRYRIFLKAGNADELAGRLGPFHTYEIVVQGCKVAVLWVPPEGNDVAAIPEKYRGGFWVIENMEYLKRLFDNSFDHVLQADTRYEILEPGEYGRPGRTTGRLILSEMNTDTPKYTPLIPILAEPHTFMMLTPADKAMDIVQAIKAKYEREMGKVRNRLPLHLGVVFAPRRQPLRALLDAGKKMLNQPATPLVWNVRCAARKQIDRGDRLPQAFRQDQNGQFKEWYEIHMEHPQKDKMLTWHVPACMGDGQTEDHWYPYAFLASESEPNGRNRYFKSDRGNPWNDSHSWLVHVGELTLDDKIYFTPATFDFEFLDANTRRHEIWYDRQGRRPLRRPRPYLLDEIDQLKEAYQVLNNYFERSQYYALVQETERKREEWFGENGFDASVKDPAFQRFVEDSFHNARTRRGNTLHVTEIKRLSDWAVRGYLRDAIELYQKILKL